MILTQKLFVIKIPSNLPTTPKPSLKFNQKPFPLLENSKKWTELKEFQQLHAQMVVTGFIHHTPSLNKLIAHVLSMGSLGVAYAYSVFTHTRELDILTWNTMLRGFVNSDMPRRALRSYIEMLQWSRIVPDRFTFPSLLKGCALSLEFKVGKVLHGQIVKYRLDSDGCMVDLLCRAGRLVEAREFIQAMPLQPNGAIWGAMLGACRVYNDLELGEESVRCLLELVTVRLSSITSPIRFWLEIVLTRK